MPKPVWRTEITKGRILLAMPTLNDEQLAEVLRLIFVLRHFKRG